MVLDGFDLDAIEVIARRAGAEIMRVYDAAGEMDVYYKDDDSPLTEADQRANGVITEALAELSPRLPILSEESALPSYAVRRRWRRYWLVDPLDGTREFVKRNGEFTVNIALIEDGAANLGVVHVPVSGVSYCGERDRGAFRLPAGAASGNSASGGPAESTIPEADSATVSTTKQAVVPTPVPIRTRATPADEPLKMVVSRSHIDPHVERVLRRLEAEMGAVELVNMGSSLKLCLIAEGKADIYPRLAPTSEWDTAAAQAVLAAAGGEVYDSRFRPLRYNRGESLLNPHFIAVADPSRDWQSLLAPVLPSS